MDIVLGISMAPDSVQMVLLQGENAHGATVDERELTGTSADDSPTVSAADRVLAALLAAHKIAVEAEYRQVRAGTENSGNSGCPATYRNPSCIGSGAGGP